MNILLAEDNPADAHLTIQAFKELESSHQRSLHHVKDGSEALQFLNQEAAFNDAPTPDLVLLDINMPRKNGIEVLQSIRANPRLKTLPVLMLTTSIADSDIEQSYQSNANAYLSKPSDIDEFFALIKTVDNFWLQRAKLPFIN